MGHLTDLQPRRPLAGRGTALWEFSALGPEPRSMIGCNGLPDMSAKRSGHHAALSRDSGGASPSLRLKSPSKLLSLDQGMRRRSNAPTMRVWNQVLARVGPTSMRKPLSRPERDDCGTSQTSIRRHPPRRSARRMYTVAPIPYRGVAMRPVGPRDAAWVPLPISTWTASSPLGPWAPDRGASGKPPIHINVMIF
jgi:hypothetical protein